MTARSDPSMWTSGAKYESYIGRWSREVAPQFLRWLSVPERAAWLDVGTGTGALADAISHVGSPTAVVGVDPSWAVVAYARSHVAERSRSFLVADAHALPFADESFDACVSALVLNFLREPARALGDMRRVVRPGGTIAAYVWDYAGEMQLLRRFWDAVDALDPAAARLNEGGRYPIARPAALARAFTEAALERVETRAIDIDTVFRDFDGLWSPFLGGQGPGPAYVASLSDDRRDALRARFRESVPVAADGTITLVARALAVRGQRP